MLLLYTVTAACYVDMEIIPRVARNIFFLFLTAVVGVSYVQSSRCEETEKNVVLEYYISTIAYLPLT